MAKPQWNGYDTDMLVAMARERWGRVPTKMLIVKDVGERTDGLCAARDDDRGIVDVFNRLASWPDGCRCLDLLDTFTPLRTVDWPGGRGCTSGHTHPCERDGRIGIFVTIDDPIGGADGVLHETAHQRLHAMGVDLERHDGLLLKGHLEDSEDGWWYPEHLYFSPIRRDVKRPMTALLHGIYAWTFMLENELANDAAEYLAINVPKVRMGLETIRECAVWTNAGRDFFEGFAVWSADCVRRGLTLLKERDMRTEPVPPPEWEV